MEYGEKLGYREREREREGERERAKPTSWSRERLSGESRVSSGKDCLRIAATVMMQRHKEGESVQKVTKHAGMWSKERETEGGRERKKLTMGLS